MRTVSQDEIDENQALKKEIFDLKSQLNRWDDQDIVRRIGIIMAAGLNISAYRVRDLETKEFGNVQFHVTYNNLVMAILSEDVAKILSKFIDDTLNPTLGPK